MRFSYVTVTNNKLGRKIIQSRFKEHDLPIHIRNCSGDDKIILGK